MYSKRKELAINTSVLFLMRPVTGIVRQMEKCSSENHVRNVLEAYKVMKACPCENPNVLCKNQKLLWKGSIVVSHTLHELCD